MVKYNHIADCYTNSRFYSHSSVNQHEKSIAEASDGGLSWYRCGAVGGIKRYSNTDYGLWEIDVSVADYAVQRGVGRDHVEERAVPACPVI